MPKRFYYALRRGADQLPVVFETKRDALDNRDPDESVWYVSVENVRLVERSKDEKEARWLH